MYFAMLSTKKLFVSILIMGLLINQVHAGEVIGTFLRAFKVENLITDILDGICDFPIAGGAAKPFLHVLAEFLGIKEVICEHHKKTKESKTTTEQPIKENEPQNELK
uniref:Uncharacterized protein n=1 Tax=Strigamia maritima TaxID=126957 RepID=T1JIG5_STRMM